MNVLYDISVLGAGHALPRERTGIFRVVEHEAYELSRGNACTVQFCTSQCNLNDCRSYLKGSPALSGHHINPPDDFVSSLYNILDPVRVTISRSGSPTLKNLLKRVYHFGKRLTRPISAQDVLAADIYHSPVHLIPEQITAEKRIATFITVHDLIPIIHPEYFLSINPVVMARTLAAITPETHIFTVSQATKNDLCNHLPRLDPERVFVTHLAAGDHFHPVTDPASLAGVRRKYAIPTERYILGLGTLEPRKNLAHTIRNFIRFVREENIRDLSLVLAGARGWHYHDIFAEIDRAGAFRHRIVLCDFVPDSDLAPLYSGALAFVYPSLYEGFGLPPLEAMQCGTPVVVSATSSLPEVVGDAGILVDPLDGDALCQALLALYSDEALRQELSSRSLRRAARFSWKKHHDATVAGYRRALSLSPETDKTELTVKGAACSQ